ncbi:hypothetical protein Tco_0751385 [Tanacetum coccineum]|uniref:Uncharacterized protein n=1 Tax=Tanacetum coccineum TaxID=301880 RepID=A0ABQ4Z3W8_9ASTR
MVDLSYQGCKPNTDAEKGFSWRCKDSLGGWKLRWLVIRLKVRNGEVFSYIGCMMPLVYQLMAVKKTSFPETECSGSIVQAYWSLLFCRDMAEDVSDGYTYPNVDEDWFERHVNIYISNASGYHSVVTYFGGVTDWYLEPRYIAVDGWMGWNADIKDGVLVK